MVVEGLNRNFFKPDLVKHSWVLCNLVFKRKPTPLTWLLPKISLEHVEFWKHAVEVLQEKLRMQVIKLVVRIHFLYMTNTKSIYQILGGGWLLWRSFSWNPNSSGCKSWDCHQVFEYILNFNEITDTLLVLSLFHVSIYSFPNISCRAWFASGFILGRSGSTESLCSRFSCAFLTFKHQ